MFRVFLALCFWLTHGPVAGVAQEEILRSATVSPVATEGNAGSSVRSVIAIEGLTLRRAIELALRHNRTLEKAAMDRALERFDLRVARDEFVPDVAISTGGRYNPVRTDGTRSTTRGAALSVAAVQRVPTGARVAVTWENAGSEIRPSGLVTEYDASVYLEVDQPLLRGGGLGPNLANLRIAYLNEETNVLAFRGALIGTITDVVFSYRALLRAKLQLEVNEAALQRARDQLAVNRTLVSAGILAPVEIIQTEADIASQEFNALTARSALESARFSLIKLLDIDRGTALDPTDEVTIPEFSLSIIEARNLAYANRADFLQTVRSVKVAELAFETARNQLQWDLSVDTRYRLSGGDIAYRGALDRTFSRDNEDWSVGISLNIPIGDLTRRQSFLRARSGVRKAELDLVESTENIEIELVDTFRGLEISRQRVKIAALARELAARKLEIEKGKLQTGLTSNFAVVTFQNDLVRARINEIDAQIGYLNALTSLDESLGTTLESWGIHVEELDDEGPPRTSVDATIPDGGVAVP